jgi:ABC-type multidrug transport system fused ATPase/permease subunit
LLLVPPALERGATLSLKNVSFGYSSERQVVKDVSLEIGAGRAWRKML